MAAVTLTLLQRDARLLYLAFVYHLARPGSELDPQTKQPLEHGLLAPAQALHAQLNAASATLELSEAEASRLTAAILGTVNELKVYPILDKIPLAEGGGRRSVVAGFDRTLRTLFPDVDDEPDVALDLAGRLIVLRRSIEAEVGQAATPVQNRQQPARRWRFWRH